MIKITDNNRQELIEKCLIEAAKTLNVGYEEVLEEAGRSDLINSASSYIDTIEKHIFMLFVIRDDMYVHHWTGELSDKAYNMITKLKKNGLLTEPILNKIFNIKDIYTFKVKLNNYINYAKTNENYIVNQHTLNIDKLYKFYVEICEWMIYQVSHLVIDPNHPFSIENGQDSKKNTQNPKKKRFKGDEKYIVIYDNYEFDLTKEIFLNINHKEMYKFIKKLYAKY